ncbi:P-loop containing nucleoside triphosphate hydrolase protein [Xylaria sp. FL1777]|nr:P-loop containing nucleoside triphosphate hydrolase protein [Xylaria sp. FL1777]
MDTQNRLPALLPKKFLETFNTSSLRTFFERIHSWVAYIREIGFETAYLSNTTENPKPLIIFILGPPGAGKGTQSALLETAFPCLTHLSYGDLLRSEHGIPGSWVSTLPRRRGGATPVVPADAAVQLIRQAIDAGMQRGQFMWLVDGFPRSEAHVEAWIAQMPVAQCTLYFSCPRDILTRRVLGRAETSGRPDDAVLSIVQERVERSINECDALLSALAKYGMPAVEIDATQKVEDIKQSVHAVSWEAINAWKLEQGL